MPDVSEQNLSADFGRATKGAAAHFWQSYIYSVRRLKIWNSRVWGRCNGNVDTSNPKSYLGMLYKGKGTADLDSCIYYASAVIDNGYYELESDFGKLFSHPLNDYSNENSRELILSCVYGPVGSADNGRFGNRLPYFLVGIMLTHLGEFLNSAGNIPQNQHHV